MLIHRLWVGLVLSLSLIACATGTTTPREWVPPSGEPGATRLPPNLPAGAGPWVTILDPQENATVNTTPITLIGQAAPGTIITFNNEIVVVDQTGEFSVMLELDEGPNVIEIVASDAAGNETTANWVITYDPPSP